MNREIEKNGIWCGENATVAAIDEYSMAFLRIKEDLIASVVRHEVYGTVGVVYGKGVNFDATAIYCLKNPGTSDLSYNEKQGKDNLKNHENDSFSINDNGIMIYTMYDGTIFELELAEKIHMADFDVENPVDNSLTIAKRMALWGVNRFFNYGDGYLVVGIDTQKYSIFYNVSIADSMIYCRVGQNGYCEKGRAMLSSTCIRLGECRMLKNNLDTLKEYKPVEDYFVTDGCAFPADGGWYWSVKQVTDDVIYLYGCGGDIYEIRRM